MWTIPKNASCGGIATVNGTANPKSTRHPATANRAQIAISVRTMNTMPSMARVTSHQSMSW